jgi:hypothetical protein
MPLDGSVFIPVCIPIDIPDDRAADSSLYKPTGTVHML